MLENPEMNVMESGTIILVTTTGMMRKLLPSAKLCHRYAKHGWKGKESVSNILEIVSNIFHADILKTVKLLNCYSVVIHLTCFD